MKRLILAVGIVIAALSVPTRAQCQPEWLPGEGVPGVAGTVAALTSWDPDGSGPQSMTLVVGGRFAVAGQTRAASIVAWDGAAWQTLGSGLGPGSAAVNALAVFRGELIAGGVFTSADGTPVSNIARWDGVAWHPLGAGIAGQVRALINFDGGLVAAGHFASAGGVAAGNVARWDGAAWTALGTGLSGPNYPLYHSVSALTVFNGQLIAGGVFAIPPSPFLVKVARWDGVTWQALAHPGAEVKSLAVYGNQLFAGLVSTPHLVIWNDGPWEEVGGGVNGDVNALLVRNGELVLGGSFSTVGGLFSPAVARWNGSGWLRGASTAEGGAVHALADVQGMLFAGGSFSSIDGGIAVGIARQGISGWESLAQGTNGTVDALVVQDGDLIAAGGFASMAGIGANHIARWDGSQWRSLGAGVPDRVEALAVYGGQLVASSWFQHHGVAQWDGQAWQPLGAGLDNSAKCFAEYDGSLIAGGYFGMAGGSPARRVAAWDGAQWHPLGEGFGDSTSGAVEALLVYRGELIAGGAFLVAGGSPANSIARWNGSVWQPLGDGLRDGARAGVVNALTEYSGDLIATGSFSTAGGLAAANIARWDGAAWSPLGQGIELGPIGAAVRTLATVDGRLIAGGWFVAAGGARAASIAAWDGVSWSPLGSGIGLGGNGQIGAMIVYRGELIAGGDFTIAGNQVSAYLARFACPCYANCDNSTAPVLSVGDFACFMTQFAAGAAYANCDRSNKPPVLNVADFVCFMHRFASGCP